MHTLTQTHKHVHTNAKTHMRSLPPQDAVRLFTSASCGKRCWASTGFFSYRGKSLCVCLGVHVCVGLQVRVCGVVHLILCMRMWV